MTEEQVIPKHIVLFPDGNRRWAKERNLPTLEGHKKGGENFEDFMGWCKSRGVETVTVFGFSTENWRRDEKEIEYLFKLIDKLTFSSLLKMMETDKIFNNLKLFDNKEL